MLEGVIVYREGDGRRAEALWKSILEREPGNVLARFDLALLLAEEGRKAEAIPHLQRVVRESKSQPLTRRARALLDQLQR